MIYDLLKDDQKEQVEGVKSSMARKNKNILLQACTGSGKTFMAMAMIEMAYHKSSGNIGFTVPRKALLDQTSESFKSLGINHSFIASGKPYNPYARVFIGMIPTMASRIQTLPELKILFIDETHYGEGYLNKIVAHYKAKGTHIVGLSATPWKSSGKGLGCYYDDMVVGKSMRWLIDNKRLSDYRYFMGKTNLDLSGLKVTAGDYNRGEVASFMESKRAIIGDAVTDYRNKAMGRLHAVRCPSVKHSEMTAQAFRDAGIPAVHVDGDTPDGDRKRIFKAYARREILVLTFADLLTFGFDLSQASGGMDVTIESGDDMKPNKSLAEWLQFIGRFLRYKDYPAMIFDRVNNWQEHGMPCADRNWTLEDRKQGKRNSDPAPPTRQCDNCFHIMAGRPLVCNECGYTFAVKPNEIEQVDGFLQELDPKVLRAQQVKERKKEQGQARTLEELIEVGKRRGMKYPTAWASKIISARMRGKR